MPLNRPTAAPIGVAESEGGGPKPRRKTLPAILSRLLRQLPFSVGLCMVLFSAANLLGEVIRPGFDANILCMPLAPLRWWGSRVVVAAVTILLGLSLARPLRRAWLYAPAEALLLFMTVGALAAAFGEWCSLFRNEVGRALPPGYLVCIVFALLSQVVRIHLDRRSSGPVSRERGRVLAGIAAVVVVLGLFLAAQFVLFGAARRVRRADCAVVLGAGVLWDGRPSRTLRDRTRTACELYLKGTVRYLIFSGGPVYGAYTEPKAMARFAVKLGVPRDVIVLDEAGNSTYDTVRNTRRIMDVRGLRTVVVVSHDYHLSRAWLTFRRAGVEAAAFPAERSRFMFRKEFLVILRECAAWGYYFIRPLWQPLR